MLFFRFSEARCVPTARAVASLFLPVFSPVWCWALKTKVLLHGVMLWVISETVGDGLLSALKGEWHDCGLLCCTKGGCSPIKSTNPQACTHMWELSGLLLSAQPRQCIILPIHVLCTWATVRFVVELSVNDQHHLPEAKQRAASGEADEWTELRPPDDKLNMEALQCLCLHSVLPCPRQHFPQQHATHTKRRGEQEEEEEEEEKWRGGSEGKNSEVCEGSSDHLRRQHPRPDARIVFVRSVYAVNCILIWRHWENRLTFYPHNQQQSADWSRVRSLLVYCCADNKRWTRGDFFGPLFLILFQIFYAFHMTCHNTIFKIIWI